MTQAIRSQTISDVIALHIERMILEGALLPGEKLAPDRELAVKFDVSRPSLREAIEKLAARGLLTATRGGTYVAQFLTPIMEPLASLYRNNQNAAADYFEFRQSVEAQAARSAALRATDVDKAAIGNCLKQMRKAHKLANPAKEAEADVSLHMLVYEAGHNMVVLHIMRALSELLRNNIFFNRENLYTRAGIREKLLTQHIEIGEAVIAGDAVAAETAAAEHIRFVANAVLEIQRANKRLTTSLMRVGRGDLLANRRSAL
jgi:GntR family transcriptional repressor for pyruvate dehydrogenase complex